MTDDDISKTLDDFANGPAADAADATAKAFELAGDRIAKALEKAARNGEFSFANLAESLSRDLAKIAIQDLIVSPLQGVISSLGKSGQSAAPAAAQNITLNISGVSDAQSFKRSEGQISASLARAAASGQRYL